MALEALSRRGLSFDEYQQQRAALTRQSSKPIGFDRQGEMNAERSIKLLGRPS
ncbi:lipoprotein [Pseudomonas fluorescens BRIP34879]|nr:lipoprotein [Pseudomonas fluorescens BRIP34879]